MIIYKMIELNKSDNSKFLSDEQFYDNLIKYLNKNKCYRLVRGDVYGFSLETSKGEVILEKVSVRIDKSEEIPGNISYWEFIDICININKSYLGSFLYIDFIFKSVEECNEDDETPIVKIDRNWEYSKDYQLEERLENAYNEVVRKSYYSWCNEDDSEEYPVLTIVDKAIGRKLAILIVNLMLKCLNKIIIVDSITMREAYNSVKAFEYKAASNNELELDIEYVRPTYTLEDALQLLGLYIKVNENDLDNASRISDEITEAGDYVLVCLNNILLMQKHLSVKEDMELVNIYINKLYTMEVQRGAVPK